MSFHDLAREYSATTGTSDAVLSGAVPGCNTWDNAGVTNGESVKYAIATYSNSSYRVVTGRETGTGTYTTSTKTLARTTVTSSTNGGSKITLTGFSQVFITPNKGDMDSWDAAGGGGVSFAQYSYNSTQSVSDNTDDNVINVNTEQIDADNLASVGSNTVTVAATGWYFIHVLVDISGSAFDGYARLFINGPSNMEVSKGYASAMGIIYDVMEIGYLCEFTAPNQTIDMTFDNHLGGSMDISCLELTVYKYS